LPALVRILFNDADFVDERQIECSDPSE